MQKIQTHLSQKQNFFSGFFSSFSKSKLNFEHFQKKLTFIAYLFPKLAAAKEGLRKMSKNSHSKGPLERRHGKRAATLIQS